MDTPANDLPAAYGSVDLRRISRGDLDALASLKLWSEVGVPYDESLAILRTCSDGWVVSFLASQPRAIGGVPIDVHVLRRARARFDQRTARATPKDELSGEETNTNLTILGTRRKALSITNTATPIRRRA